MHCQKPLSEKHYASDLGDYIGMESGFDRQSDTESVVNIQREFRDGDGNCNGERSQSRPWELQRKKEEKDREYPPPIPWLARTGNLLCHMPWVLERYYTSDGRLIIRREKVRRHEYFRVQRANGRLTLQLVSLDNVDLDDNIGEENGWKRNEEEMEDHEEETFDENGDYEGRCPGGGDDSEDVGTSKLSDEEEEEEEEEEKVARILPKLSLETAASGVTGNVGGSGVGVGGGGGGKCYNYNSLQGSNPCIFGMAVPAIGPVHT